MTAIMFLLAVGLLAVGAIGGTQAALNIRSNNYYSAFDLDHIGVALIQGGENPVAVAWRTYGAEVDGTPDVKLDGNLTPDLGNDVEVLLGKRYDLPIKVQNTGTIDQYVRVTLRKYWVTDAAEVGAKGYFHGDGTKVVNAIYRPDLIKLGFDNNKKITLKAFNSDSWILDDGASTAEREVYYYNGILTPGEISATLIDNISISPEVTKEAVVTKDGNKTIYTYAYDGIGFVVTAEVDAVQTHHAWAAMTSAWGTSSKVMTAMGIPNEA